MAKLWKAKWTALNYPHSICRYAITPTGNNRENYIVIGYDTIYRYDFATDTWLKLMDKPTDLPRVTRNVGCHSALDSSKGELWIFQSNKKLAHIYLNENKQCEINNIDFGCYACKCIVINNRFTIIGGMDNNSIKQWNESNKQFTNITTICDPDGLANFGLVYVKSTNCLLLFGGYWDAGRARLDSLTAQHKSKYMDSILQYNITQNKCNKLPISLPKALCQCACTMAIRNQYILIFGGGCGEGYFDDIYIYSIKRKTLKISNIRCPSKDCFSAMTVNNEMKDEKTVFGFVRNQWKASQIDDHYFPPYYLLKMMHAYYLNEFVYLLDFWGKTHWKISTLDIIFLDIIQLIDEAAEAMGRDNPC